jgi:hypothetical protein
MQLPKISDWQRVGDKWSNTYSLQHNGVDFLAEFCNYTYGRSNVTIKRNDVSLFVADKEDNEEYGELMKKKYTDEYSPYSDDKDVFLEWANNVACNFFKML